jgi:hypothetical protein
MFNVMAQGTTEANVGVLFYELTRRPVNMREKLQKLVLTRATIHTQQVG